MEEIYEILNLNPVHQTCFKGPVYKTGLTYNEKKSIYINKYGLIQLALKSEKKEIVKFQTKLIKKVVPSLLDKKYYIPNSILVINLDTSFIVAIDKIEQYYGYKVVYMELDF